MPTSTHAYANGYAHPARTPTSAAFPIISSPSSTSQLPSSAATDTRAAARPSHAQLYAEQSNPGTREQFIASHARMQVAPLHPFNAAPRPSASAYDGSQGHTTLPSSSPSSSPNPTFFTSLLDSVFASRYSGVILFLCLLPFPPVLALLFVFVGHAILRVAQPADFFPAPLLTSVQAGAVGGAVLAVLVLLSLYALLRPFRARSGRISGSEQASEREDFFDDFASSSSSTTRSSPSPLNPRVLRILALSLALALVVFLGTYTGALGAAILRAGNPAWAGLSAERAAQAGAVGGVVICGAAGVLGGIGWLAWVVCGRWAGTGDREAVEKPEGHRSGFT